jgi:mono/diheme cytochrome c family protein
MKRAILSLVFVATAWVPWSVAQNVSQNASAGDAASGKQLFMKDGCSYCHGTVGQGGGGRTGGLRLAQMPIPFAAFLNQLRHPANEMPPYVAAVVSDQDATDIYAYIKGLPPPPDAKSIPALNALDN